MTAQCFVEFDPSAYMRSKQSGLKSENTWSMTFIRRLEMRGFKSSGSRPVAVNMEPGFTVITGPNGSGKSNIADAILFAIGENSPKQLRAANGKLSGVIYDPKKVADLTPEEKRRIIEDVVGIAKFDEKKSEAQRQLSQADQRLEVALARIGEMKSTLGSLDLQRNDLIRYNLLENQINWLRAVETSGRIMEQKGKVASLKTQEDEMRGRIQELSDRRQEFENRISQVENERTRFIVDVVQGGGASHVDLQFQLAQVDNELQTLQGDLQDAEANLLSLGDETIPSLKQIVGTKEKEVSASSSTLNRLAAELAKLDERRKDLVFWLEEIVGAEAVLRQTIDGGAKQKGRVELKISEISQKLNVTELAINAANANLSAEKKRLEELRLRVNGYSEVLSRLEANTKQLFELFEGSTQELNHVDQDLSAYEEKRALLLGSIEQASRTLEKASREVSKEEAFREVSESVAGERTEQSKLQEFCEGGGVAGCLGRG